MSSSPIEHVKSIITELYPDLKCHIHENKRLGRIHIVWSQGPQEQALRMALSEYGFDSRGTYKITTYRLPDNFKETLIFD